MVGLCCHCVIHSATKQASASVETPIIDRLRELEEGAENLLHRGTRLTLVLQPMCVLLNLTPV